MVAFKKVLALLLTFTMIMSTCVFVSFADAKKEEESTTTISIEKEDMKDTTKESKTTETTETEKTTETTEKDEVAETTEETEAEEIEETTETTETTEATETTETTATTETSETIETTAVSEASETTTKVSEVTETSTTETISKESLKDDIKYNSEVASNSEIVSEETGQENNKLFGTDELEWTFSAFGSGVNTTDNGHVGEYLDGAVEVFSLNKKGKLVPASTDGLAFYFTKINPLTKNFKLSADAEVLSWTLSNGQDGFGLMACDRVGVNGDSTTFWNNSYMASVTKVEYFWDGEKVSTTGDKITMKLGVGSQEKKGVTLDNIRSDYTLDDMSLFSSTMTTLDITCASDGAGTYNLVGNYTNETAPIGTIDNPRNTFHLSIEKNNTGYFVSYTDLDGDTTTKKYYDTNVLNYLDPNFVYLGFFASRNADIRFTNISFTTSDPSTDPDPEDPTVIYIDPNYQVVSSSITNKSDYDLRFFANADGTISVKMGGSDIFSGNVTANEALSIPTNLTKGENEFTLVMTPDPNYRPSANERLSSYDPVTINFKVQYYDGFKEEVFVSPNGLSQNEGTREKPTSLTEAVKKGMPGQTIYLMEGEYKLTETLVIERGIDGTSSSNINLFVDPKAKSRPVLNFEKLGGGLTLAGNYWHLKGFDVTRTADMQKGVLIAGNYNTIESVNAYRNGNTGIQLSRYKNSDDRYMWPSYNLIKNCTSSNNADQGYEDADGFAAKITCGEGNVFDGCIAANNADDGWDLFAKLEHGSIGKVTIKNSIAYKNGYIIDESGKEVHAGNGNGFKLGGESISGYHKLINSIAFANSQKGIDANSCPDDIVEQCTSFNNESHNVALYTNTAHNTDFSISGVISYKNNNNIEEKISPVGTQDEKKIYNETNYYYIDGKFVNTDGVEVKDDWFVSLDVDKAINGGITRNSDGSINMNGFLELTDKAPKGSGAVINPPTPPIPPAPHYDPSDDGGSSNDSSNPSRGPMGDLTKNPAYANLINSNSLNTTNNIPKSKLVNDLALETLLKSFPENAGSTYVNAKDSEGNTGFGQWLRVSNTTTWYFLSGNNSNATLSNDNYGFVSNGWFNISWNGEDRWYHFDEKGIMQLGWYHENGKTYYLQDNISDMWYGQLLTGTHVINGNTYTFDGTGALIR